MSDFWLFVGLFIGIVISWQPNGHCVRFGFYKIFRSASVCIRRIHVASLTRWQDEVLVETFDVDVSSNRRRVAAAQSLASSETSVSVVLPVLLPVAFL